MSSFTLVDFSVPTRDHPMSHSPAQPPLCGDCRSLDLCFFNPLCPGCQDILLDSKTTISELFAVMRQWVPQTQRNLSSLTREVLRRGANINDRDGLTDLSLLHYASKAGAAGVGSSSSAANLVQSLINKGADAALRCRWTDMNAMHYAVYFDAAETVRVLAEQNPSLVMSTCSELSNGNCLHLAAANLSLEAGKVLLQYGADGSAKDGDGKLPYEVIPDNLSSEQANVCKEFIELLKNAAENPPPKPADKNNLEGKSSPLHVPAPLILPRVHEPPSNVNLSSSHHKISGSLVPKSPAPSNTSTISTTSTTHTAATSSSSPRVHSPSPTLMHNQVTMATLGLKVGDKILIDASSSKPKHGTIRFGGITEFQPGQWAGIELDEPIGKNDGSYGGIRYFTCKSKFGLFVPMHRISKDNSDHQLVADKKKRKKTERHSITSMAIEAQSHLRMNNEIELGERVAVSGNRLGVLRYAGTVKFAPGFWMGVELDAPTGRNDGSMNGVQYFKCRPRHGIFVLQSKVTRSSEPHHHLTAQARRTLPLPSSRTPVSSGTESVDFSSRSVSLTTSGASGASEAEMSTPSPHASPAASRKRLTVNSNNNNSRCSGSLSKQSNRSGGSSVASSKTNSTGAGSRAAKKPLSPEVTLGMGMSIFVNKEMGVVKYLGKTDFEDGIWLGVELRKPVGKNDGSVQGKRYFTCKPNYGLFVKPDKASHRGIRCSKILPKNV